MESIKRVIGTLILTFVNAVTITLFIIAQLLIPLSIGLGIYLIVALDCPSHMLTGILSIIVFGSIALGEFLILLTIIVEKMKGKE